MVQVVSRLDAVLIDAGGVLLLSDREAVANAVGQGPWDAQQDLLDRAHYIAVAAVDEICLESDRAVLPRYVATYVESLGVSTDRLDAARTRLLDLFGKGTPSWRTVLHESVVGVRAIADAGLSVAVVSNSYGWMQEWLRDLGVCQVGPGPAASISAVIDSGLLGVKKPDPRIFEAAVRALGCASDRAVHVGDSVCFDVEGALAAGIRALHFDPYGLCLLDGHEHIKSLVAVVPS